MAKKTDRNFPGVAPKRGRLTKDEIALIQLLIEEGVAVKAIAERTGRSEASIMNLVPEGVVAKTEEEPQPVEESKEVDFGPDLHFDNNKNTLANSGVGHRPSMPSNGNIAVMTKAGSDIGDKAREEHHMKNERQKLFSRCIRPIKGYSDEKVKEIEKFNNEEFVKENENLVTNIKKRKDG